MNAQLSAIVVASLLALGTAQATMARGNDAPQARRTGVGQVISQQGNEALHRIRSELANNLRESVALPELAGRVEVGRVELEPVLLSPSVRAALTP